MPIIPGNEIQPHQHGKEQTLSLSHELAVAGFPFDQRVVSAFEAGLIATADSIYHMLLHGWGGFGYSSIEHVYRRGTCKIVTEHMLQALVTKFPGAELMRYSSMNRLFHYFIRVPFHTGNGLVNICFDPTWQQCLEEFDDSLPPVVVWAEDQMRGDLPQPAFWQHISPYIRHIWTDAQPVTA